jgi:hypothetical protein
MLTAEPESQRQSKDHAEGTQGLHHNKAGFVQSQGLEGPPTDLEGTAQQPDRLTDDLRQKTRITFPTEV